MPLFTQCSPETKPGYLVQVQLYQCVAYYDTNPDRDGNTSQLDAECLYIKMNVKIILDICYVVYYRYRATLVKY